MTALDRPREETGQGAQRVSLGLGRQVRGGELIDPRHDDGKRDPVDRQLLEARSHVVLHHRSIVRRVPVGQTHGPTVDQRAYRIGDDARARKRVAACGDLAFDPGGLLPRRRHVLNTAQQLHALDALPAPSHADVQLDEELRRRPAPAFDDRGHARPSSCSPVYQRYTEPDPVSTRWLKSQ